MAETKVSLDDFLQTVTSAVVRAQARVATGPGAPHFPGTITVGMIAEPAVTAPPLQPAQMMLARPNDDRDVAFHLAQMVGSLHGQLVEKLSDYVKASPEEKIKSHHAFAQAMFDAKLVDESEHATIEQTLAVLHDHALTKDDRVKKVNALRDGVAAAGTNPILLGVMNIASDSVQKEAAGPTGIIRLSASGVATAAADLSGAIAGSTVGSLGGTAGGVLGGLAGGVALSLFVAQ